ncbi:MAG TPA: hypothetical protein VK203_25250 [Nostocaceae cyanobacterium]|nr:hypothetical protein [Nostocaceae cyanobacterium]
MSENLNSPSPLQPLSIGNVVSASVRLYRSRLKTYLRLAVIAHLWAIVPVYGWAKYAAMSGLISRLAFGELIYQPETVAAAQEQVERRLWSFLRVSFQVGLSILVIYFALAIVAGIAAGILGVLLGAIFGNSTAIVAIITILIFLLVFGFIILGITWFYARWSVAEVPLAVEENINGAESVARSWELTKSSAIRVQGVVLVAGVVTAPILILFNYGPALILNVIEQGTTLYWIIYSISLILSFVGGIFVMPFWQTIKAVLYCDLRSRREGLGLQLRDGDL